MNLKNCQDCGKQYSLRAPTCIHCGAPNDDLSQVNQAEKDSDDNSIWGWIGSIVFGVVVFLAMAPDVRVHVLRMLNPNSDVVTENEMRSCDSTGAYNQMKSAFDQSQYALSLNLKAITVQTKQLDTESGSTMTCQAEIMLNNSEKIRYVFNFIQQNDQYLIQGRSDE
ncbi:hypothetical protein A3K93_10810 [Acinetobacter sp. NCu2D-2]|uniref:hypothetical protein n=1 Tax=Acinetobacter sp. NCu2D-2 TaxID=1608473 RepID=UPI0007CE07AB|nr:hypothetical protein [Acinetobacter sp. NCu2D-2]ANF82634.1 hypothetical protein A3K93_10810 [Acinetobacter sp. NCu2D-2]